MRDNRRSTLAVEVENLGGITHAKETLAPGTNVLAGANATNRTSFLEALATGLGGREATLKTDAEEGFVRIEIGDDTYERRVIANAAGTGPRIEGEGYVADPESAELFAWFLSDNDIRQALRTGADLRDLVMRPVDTDEIERREAELVAKREEIEADIAELEEIAEQFAEVKAEVGQSESEVEALKTELEAKRTELAAVDREVEEARQERSEREETLESLKDARSQRESIHRTIDQQKDALSATEGELEAKRAEREHVRDELSELEIDPNRVQAEIRELQSEQDQFRTLKESLNNIISFNEQQLQAEESEPWGLVRADEPSGVEQLTKQLEGDTGPKQLDCWTCGSRVEVTAIESQLDRLRSQQQRLTKRLTDLEEEIESLWSQRRRYETLQGRIDELDTEIRDLEEEVATRRSHIATHEERLAEVDAQISDLEATLDELETEAEEADDVLTLQREVNELEFELETSQRRLEQARERRDELEAQLDRRETLEAEHDEISEELTEVRNEIDRVETTIVETFNEHMETLIDILAYENITRVWLEAKQPNGDDTTFELHIVRETGDGRAYEDTVETLSESEREVVAITFALAGYIANDVHEEMPVILLDSVEMIDAIRLGRLFDYFNDLADFIVVALLQEDADEIDDEDCTMIDFGRSKLIQ